LLGSQKFEIRKGVFIYSTVFMGEAEGLGQGILVGVE